MLRSGRLVPFLLCWLSPLVAAAGTIYVAPTGSSGNDGSSWAQAFDNPQQALAVAASGDEIWVAAGTYKPTSTTDRTISFVLKNGVGVYGGFVGTETLRTQRDPVAHPTILSGDVGAVPDATDNSYHVVTSGSTVTATGVLDGFTVSGGRANGAGANQDRGGGMWINGGSVTVAHIVFLSNTAAEMGGGIRVSAATPSIDGCTFDSNGAGTGGGGIGADFSTFTVKNSVFRTNSSPSTAGAGLEADSSVTVVNCVFQGNTGNGVLFTDNGGVTNSTFTGNTSYGVAFLNDGTVVNSVLWNDAIDEVFVGFGFIAVTYSDVGGSGFFGTGNKSSDPLFVNPAGHDLRLGAGSPAVDAGRNTAVPAGITTDAAGQPRFQDDPSVVDTGLGSPPIVDMGAYERAPAPPPAFEPFALAVDSSGNHVLEPGESVSFEPSWFNAGASAASPTGTATSFTGPSGVTYGISDASASYGSVAAGTSASCLNGGNCYAISISTPASRPVQHWDATLSETLSTGESKSWLVHVGESFTDVPTSLGVYRFVETLLHDGVTAGCGGTLFCPSSNVTRQQMAVFLLVSKEGSSYSPPACVTPVFNDVPCSSGFAKWIDELAARNVTAGCGNGNYCPMTDVTRAQMAVFLLKTAFGPSYVPPTCTTPTFSDLPCSNGFAAWVDDLAGRGITAGCAPGMYCPNSPVTRGQMAVFLTATYGLKLYGP